MMIAGKMNELTIVFVSFLDVLLIDSSLADHTIQQAFTNPSDDIQPFFKGSLAEPDILL